MTVTETTNKADARISLRWIPKDSRRIEHALGVCYVEDNLQRGNRAVFTVMGYIGTAGKSAFYESAGKW